MKWLIIRTSFEAVKKETWKLCPKHTTFFQIKEDLKVEGNTKKKKNIAKRRLTRNKGKNILKGSPHPWKLSPSKYFFFVDNNALCGTSVLPNAPN